MPGFINRRLLIAVGVILTAFCLVAILRLLDWSAVWALFSRLDAATLLLGLAIYFASLWLRAWRARLLLREADGRFFRVRELLPVVLWHNFYNRVLPFRTGEASYVVLLGRINGQTLDRGLSSLVVSRLYDGLASMVLLTLGFLWLDDPRLGWLTALLGGVVLGLLSVLFVLPWFLRRSGGLLVSWAQNPRLAVLTRLKGFLDAIELQVRAVNRGGLVLKLLALSFGVWLCVYGFYTTLMVGCGLISPDLSGFSQVVVGSTLSLFIFMLPINLASGPMEAGWTAGFLFVGLSSAEALSSGFGINAITHLANLLFILPLIGLWIAPNRRKIA